MSKPKAERKGRDPGLTIRVPLAIVEELRGKVDELPPSPLVSRDEMLVKLAQRALAIGVKSARLVPDV